MTPKQKNIYHELLKGKSYKQISDKFFISENTVKSHCRIIYRYHKVKNRNELMANKLVEKNPEEKYLEIESVDN